MLYLYKCISVMGVVYSVIKFFPILFFTAKKNQTGIRNENSRIQQIYWEMTKPHSESFQTLKIVLFAKNMLSNGIVYSSVVFTIETRGIFEKSKKALP